MFEVYLQRFRNRQPAGASRQNLYHFFQPYIEESPESDQWTVRYGESEWCELSLTPLPGRTDLIHATRVYRPCSDQRLWESILEAMKQEGLVLYFAGAAPPLVAQQEVADHLPEDMAEVLGDPVCVSSVNEIQEIIRKG